jgi:hypothetical protein
MHPTHTQPTVTGVEPTPAQTLRDAALYLERHGWIQGELYGDHIAVIPPACAVGAIRCALFGSPIVTATYEQTTQADPIVGVLAHHLHDTGNDTPPDTDEWGPTPWDSPNAIITDWNDASGRTADEVIATLRAVADQWDRIHGGAQ